MAFQVKKFNSILSSMINWMSSATERITDYNKGSVVRTILEAVAMELEELYYQLLQATQEAIEEAIYRTFNFPRNPAEKATGTVRFTRLTGTEVIVTIPSGTLVGTDTEPPIVFETQADDIIEYITGTATGVSGTADAAVTTTTTKLTDTRLSLGVNAYVGAIVTCNSKTMTVVSNDATSFTGASWSGGGTPGNGFAWSISGTTVLTDSATDFITEGIIAGSTVKKTSGTTGEATVATVTLHALKFTGALTNAQTFAGGGQSYKVIVPYKDIAVQAVVAGVDSNVAANTLTVLRSSVANIATVNNAAAISDGLDEETDTSRKTRFSLYISSLARATRSALEYAAKTVEQITAAKAIDDVRPTVYVYNNSGAIFWTDITTEMRNPSDAAVLLFPDPQGSNDALYIGGEELFNYVNFHFKNAGTYVGADNVIWEYYSDTGWKTLSVSDGTDAGTGPFTQDGTVKFTMPSDWVSYDLLNETNPPASGILRLWIRLRITSTPCFNDIPEGDFCSLPPGFGYVYLYCHDGSGNLSTDLQSAVEAVVELYRGCGIIVTVLAPTKIEPTITFTLQIAENYDGETITDETIQAVIDHLNAKSLGEDLYLAELYQLIMSFNDKAIINCTLSAPTSDILVPGSAVLRADPTLITATYTQG